MRFLRVLVALGLVLVVGCTSTPTPEPTAAPTSAPEPSRAPDPVRAQAVGVVVAPQPDRAVILERLRELTARRDEVDWELADATTNATVADLVGRFVDRGLDLVCVVGPGQADRIASIAQQVPRGRFCVGPTTLPDDPVANVLYVDLRVEETAYLAGALAGLVDPLGRTGIITSRTSYRAARQQESFEKGLTDVGAPATVTVTGPVADDDAARSAIDAQFEADIGVVFADTGPFDDTLVEIAVDRARRRAEDAENAAAAEVPEDGEVVPAPPPTGLILGESVVADVALEDVVLAVVRQFPERIVIPAVDRLLSTWEPGQVSVGLTEDAVSIDLAATPLAAPHVDVLNRFRGEIAAGDRNPG